MESLKKIAGKINNISVRSLEIKAPFVDLVSRFSEDPGTVALMSGGDLDCARYHILAIRPWLEIKGYGRKITLTADGQTILLDGDPFDALRQVINEYAMVFDDLSIPIATGLFGYLSYDLKDFIEELPRTSVDDSGLPQLCFFAPSAIIIHDKLKNQTQLCVANRLDHNNLKIGDNIESIEALLIANDEKRDKFEGGATDLQSLFSQPEYMAAVTKIKKYIVSGDIYQVNLSQRFETDFSGNAFAMFKLLYQIAPAPFYAYINAGDHQIVSTSPERFLKRRTEDVETRPIKGTRPRGKDISEDQELSKDLLKSKKDDAELSMIVDLMRNDLGRVCCGGSIKVVEHRRLEAYHNVFHLVSVVKGKLQADKDSIDLIKATFPGGSITGCPRIRAMEIIDELEPVRRHIYTGSIGYLSFHESLDLSIAIRTATIFQNRILFSVGGGVVFDSDPADEFEETLHKGRSLMGVLLNKKTGSKADEWLWQNGKLVPKNQAMVSVADLGFQYGLGFFETIRVENGQPAFLKDHVQRFYRAWKVIFKTPVPDLTWDVIIRQVIEKNGLEKQTAAVKIMASFGDPAAFPLHHNLMVTARKYAPRPAIINKNGLDLVTFPDPRQTPLAAHKTLNYAYYFIAGKWAHQQGADEALILNPDGSISETNTANILLINDKDKKVICPKSPHVLSGIMEKQVIQHLVNQGVQVENRKIMPEELFSADQVVMTNSLIGAVPVVSLDGEKTGWKKTGFVNSFSW
ncbi:MAG: aminodeoxychorismate synthase component I [Desulfobacteraceae bacterium]|nr:aminodeoxychorismate synthase component I [Desulfobacteraceae bacterium]